MASSPKGLRLLKAIEYNIRKLPRFDAVFVLQKMQLESASDGVLKGSFKVEPTMCNVGGTVHGGYLASVADVFSFYSHFSKPDGKVCWTTSMNIMYVGPAKEGETVKVETKPVKSGNNSVIETYFYGQEGGLIAKGTSTFTAGKDKYQHLFKELTGFDVNEN